MPSLFEKATKKLVKEIGDKKLRPVKCLERATKIRRFSLIQRKKARSLFWQLPDVPLDVSLMHILERGSSAPETAVKVPALFSDTVVRKQQATGNVNAGAEAGFSEETTVCRGSSLEYQIVSTPHETWTELQERKLLNPEPVILKQCRKAGVNLYVVTDTVELLNSTELQDLSSANVSGKFSIPLNSWVKGEGQGGGSKVRQKKLTVPKGSVLAYRRKQLVFYNKGWGIHHIEDDDDEETFSSAMGPATPPKGIHHIAEMLPIIVGAMGPATPPMGIHQIGDYAEVQPIRVGATGPATPPMGIHQIGDYAEVQPIRVGATGPATPPMGIHQIGDYAEVQPIRVGATGPATPPMGIQHIADDEEETTIPADFKLLQEEVSHYVEEAELSKGMQGAVFSSLRAMLVDREALQDLLDKLELEPFGHLDGPGGTILTELQKDSGYPWFGPKLLILYLLEALMVLSDIQLGLLAQSMEKRMLLPQRDLVRSILEPNFNGSQNIPFTLQPELLAPLRELGGLDITYELLDECGLQMEPNSPTSAWDPEAQGPLSALYGTLSVLGQLAEA